MPIGVVTEMHKEPTLTEAKFEIEKASGFWNKTMTLKGKKYGASTYEDLMKITYTYNGSGKDKGWGTTSVYKVTKNGQTTTNTLIQQQVCNTKVNGGSTYGQGTQLLTNNEMSKTPDLAINENSSQTKCWYKSGLNSDTFIDVSTMNDIYLQMDVPKATEKKKPTILKSNDPATADRLYIDEVEVVPDGRGIDIFAAVPCGQPSRQAWEDGGNETPAPVVNADFFYKVTGRCDYSERPIGISLTK